MVNGKEFDNSGQIYESLKSKAAGNTTDKLSRGISIFIG